MLISSLLIHIMKFNVLAMYHSLYIMHGESMQACSDEKLLPISVLMQFYQ